MPCPLVRAVENVEIRFSSTCAQWPKFGKIFFKVVVRLPKQGSDTLTVIAWRDLWRIVTLLARVLCRSLLFWTKD